MANTGPVVYRRLLYIVDSMLVHVQDHLQDIIPIQTTPTHHTLLTLQLRSLSNKMFLAAIFLCTKDFRDRQARPSTTCLQNWSSKLGRSGLDS